MRGGGHGRGNRCSRLRDATAQRSKAARQVLAQLHGSAFLGAMEKKRSSQIILLSFVLLSRDGGDKDKLLPCPGTVTAAEGGSTFGAQRW